MTPFPLSDWQVSPGLEQIEGPALAFIAIVIVAFGFAALTGKWD